MGRGAGVAKLSSVRITFFRPGQKLHVLRSLTPVSSIKQHPAVLLIELFRLMQPSQRPEVAACSMFAHEAMTLQDSVLRQQHWRFQPCSAQLCRSMGTAALILSCLKIRQLFCAEGHLPRISKQNARRYSCLCWCL